MLNVLFSIQVAIVLMVVLCQGKLKCVESSLPGAVSLFLIEPHFCQYILGVESLMVYSYINGCVVSGEAEVCGEQFAWSRESVPDRASHLSVYPRRRESDGLPDTGLPRRARTLRALCDCRRWRRGGRFCRRQRGRRSQTWRSLDIEQIGFFLIIKKMNYQFLYRRLREIKKFCLFVVINNLSYLQVCIHYVQNQLHLGLIQGKRW